MTLSKIKHHWVVGEDVRTLCPKIISPKTLSLTDAGCDYPQLAALEERARQLRDRKQAAKEALSDGDGFDIGIVDGDDMDDGDEDNDVDDIDAGDGGGKPAAAAAAAAAIARHGSRRSMAVSSSTTLTPGSSPSQVMEALQAGATPMPQSVQELATETEAMTKEVPMRYPANCATNIITITIVAVVLQIVEMEAALATRRAKLEEAKAVATARLEKRRSELASTASLVQLCCSVAFPHQRV